MMPQAGPYSTAPQWQAGPGSPAPRTNTVEVVFAWIFALLTFLYMLPWAIAATRGKQDSMMIAVINFFLGWSIVGWIVALVMACSSNPPPASVNVVQTVNFPPNNLPPRQY